jgi:hypothetical protein
MGYKIRVSTLARYCKNTLGYGSQNGLSIYKLTVKALERNGVFKLSKGSDKTFVSHHYGKILRAIESFKASNEVANAEFLASREFLDTYEWKKLRMEAIKLHGNTCQCCGAGPATGAVINVDHIKPRRYFPELALDLTNLQILCGDCNHGKGNWDSTDWR